jgi:hypothetical protein
VKVRIQTREEKLWRESVLTKSKLRTYAVLKTQLKMEDYLQVKDRCGVPELTKLRGGTNRLRIEKGRYQGLPAEERVCEFCNKGEVEDERHFVLSCPLYSTVRAELWTETLPRLPQPLLTEEAKFVALLQSKDADVIKKVLRYVKQAMKVRRAVEKAREKEQEEKAQRKQAKRRVRR